MIEPQAYPIIIEPWYLVSSLVPYVIHTLMALLQGCIVLILLIWAIRILKSGRVPSYTLSWFPFFQKELKQSRVFSYGLLFLGLLIMAPFFFGWSVVLSGIGLTIVVFFCLTSKWTLPFKVLLPKIGLTFVTIVVLSFLIWEQADPAQYGTYLCFKALDWRIEETIWQKKMDVNAPKIGQLAPNFELLSTDDQDTFRLSDYTGKKLVALVFGSHTCPPHSDGTVIIQELYKKYQDKVAFINIYLTEAHPIEKWWLGESNTQKAIYHWTGALARLDMQVPQNIAERKNYARTYRKTLFENKLPIYVDRMDNTVSKMYAAKPTRIYLIGLDGRVVYNPGFGPASFNAKHLGKQIEKYLTHNPN